MGLEVFNVLVCEFLGVYLTNLVRKDIAVLLDVVLLIEFLPQGDDILVRHIGVGVELRTGGGIGGTDVFFDEVLFPVEVLPVVVVLDVSLCNFLVD